MSEIVERWGGSKAATVDKARRYAEQIGQPLPWVLATLLHEALLEIEELERRGIRPSTLCGFGAWLSESMDSRGMTQADLARRCGLSRTEISYIVNGRVSPRLETVARIMEVLV